MNLVSIKMSKKWGKLGKHISPLINTSTTYYYMKSQAPSGCNSLKETGWGIYFVVSVYFPDLKERGKVTEERNAFDVFEKLWEAHLELLGSWGMWNKVDYLAPAFE